MSYGRNRKWGLRSTRGEYGWVWSGRYPHGAVGTFESWVEAAEFMRRLWHSNYKEG